MTDNVPSLKLQEVADEEGFDSIMEMLEHYTFESIVPACCEELCQVEPDGVCPHEHLSVLRTAGLI